MPAIIAVVIDHIFAGMARSYTARLQPNRIPKRIVAKPLYQSCPHGIGYQISGNLPQIFFRTQSMIVVRLFPERASSCQLLIGQAGAG